MKVDVCIILINYNTLADTVECVRSLQNLNGATYRIVLVDNASEDAPIIKVNEYLNQTCDIVYAQSNHGFSAGNNIGIRYAKEKYAPSFYWVLNNDTVVEPDSLSRMMEMAQSDLANVGLVSGRIHYYNDRNKADYRGGYFDYKRGRPVYYNVLAPIHEEITFATGCTWLLPCHTIDRVGYLNEKFFMYAEDTDYCCRIIQAGLKILYCDQSLIYHKISASSDVGSDFSAFYMLRNGIYIMNQYARNKAMAWLIFCYELLKDLVKRRKKVGVTMRALWAGLRGETGRNGEY